MLQVSLGSASAKLWKPSLRPQTRPQNSCRKLETAARQILTLEAASKTDPKTGKSDSPFLALQLWDVGI